LFFDNVEIPDGQSIFTLKRRQLMNRKCIG
jgi:hypothetical protein